MTTDSFETMRQRPIRAHRASRPRVWVPPYSKGVRTLGRAALEDDTGICWPPGAFLMGSAQTPKDFVCPRHPGDPT